jgi:hypothetical protein
VLHGEAVAGEGVGGVCGEDFVEGGDLVHELMVRCGGCRWQVSDGLTRICTDDTDWKNGQRQLLEAGPPLREGGQV